MKKVMLRTIVMIVLLLGIFSATTVCAMLPPLPDFVIESISVYPEQAAEGTPVSVTVVVKNQGEVVGDGRYLDIWHNPTRDLHVLGDVGDWWAPVGPLDAGESRTITSPETFFSVDGTNQLLACIEFEDFVSEASNTNNCRTLSYTAVPVTSLLLPVYRFWSPVYRGHFYTMSEAEKNNIIAKLAHDWTYEGVAYYAFSSATVHTVPVYRFWSARFKGHFYTISENEKNSIIANLSHDWSYEGVTYHVYSSYVVDSMPVYRFWSPRYRHHFFTISEQEKNNIIANLSFDWNYEGIAFYVPTISGQSSSATAPPDGASSGAKTLVTAEVASFGLSAVSEDERNGVEHNGVGQGGVSTTASETLAETGIDVIYPLTYSGGVVTAYVYDSAAEQWTCVLPATNLPVLAVLENIQPDRSYLLDVFVGDSDDAEMVSVHQSSFVYQLDPPEVIHEDSDTVASEDGRGVGSPIARIKTPVVDGSLTVKLYSSSQGVLETLVNVSGGEMVELAIPEWNCWYWISGWSDADNELVLSIWLRHEN